MVLKQFHNACTELLTIILRIRKKSAANQVFRVKDRRGFMFCWYWIINVCAVADHFFAISEGFDKFRKR